MGRGRDRGERRRQFDDDDYMPPPRYASPSPPVSRSASGPEVDATVKWFNPDKGFGFVELADGSGDVFLHVNTLQAAGHDTVAPGAQLRVQVGEGTKGRQVSAVLGVTEGAAPTSNQRAPRRDGERMDRKSARPRADLSSAIQVAGAVKWFNAEKGFGFVQADDGLKDVFVHVSVLNQAGMAALMEGQRVAMQVVTTPKGREAVSISPGG